MRWFQKMYLYGVVFFRPLRVTSLVTFVKESAGYLDLPQIWYVGPLNALIPKMYLYGVVFFVPYELQAL